MISAIVLVNCRFPFNESILEELKRLPSITCIYRTSGIYDIILKISDVSPGELQNTVCKEINAIPDVFGTITMVIA